MNKRHRLLLTAAVCCCTVMLTSCDSSSHKKSKTQAYIQHSAKKYQSKIPAVVPKPNLPKTTYRAQMLRDPFIPPQPRKNKHNLANTIFRTYSIDNLTLVGIIGEGKSRWAMISSPDGNLAKVKIGAHIGSAHALVAKIGNDKVQLIIDVNSSINSEPTIKTLTLSKK